MFTRRMISRALGILIGATILAPFATARSQTMPREPVGLITGVVYDLNGVPVDGALVVTLDQTGSAVARQFTTQKGMFGCVVHPGIYTLQAGLSQFPTGSAQVSVKSGMTVEANITIREVAPAGTLTGFVYDLDGNEVASALVVIDDANGISFARQLTQSDGSFQFELSPGRYTIKAGLKQFPSGQTDASIRQGRTTTIRMTIREHTQYGQIAGLVLDQRGATVPNARVLVYNGLGIPIARQVTGGDGSFEFEFAAGTYTLLAGLNRFPSGRIDISLQPGDRLELKLIINE